MDKVILGLVDFVIICAVIGGNISFWQTLLGFIKRWRKRKADVEEWVEGTYHNRRNFWGDGDGKQS